MMDNIVLYLLLGTSLAVQNCLAQVKGEPLLKDAFVDCNAAREAGHMKSGTYMIKVNSSFIVNVHCEHTVNKSYTIFQQRMNGDQSFARNIQDYEVGFGNSKSDYWMGLIAMKHLTDQGNTVLDIQLQDWQGNNRGGTYKYFALGDRNDRYRLQISSFTGNVPDDMSYSNNMQFSTYDYPDYYNCATNQKVGWWYNYCAYALLNGYYYRGTYPPSAAGWYDGIYWKDWLGYGYSLRFTRMMLSKP